MTPLLLDENAVLTWALYAVAAGAGLALLFGAGLWWALRKALKAQAAGPAATARPGCLAALVVGAVLGLLLLRLLV